MRLTRPVSVSTPASGILDVSLYRRATNSAVADRGHDAHGHDHDGDLD